MSAEAASADGPDRIADGSDVGSGVDSGDDNASPNRRKRRRVAVSESPYAAAAVSSYAYPYISMNVSPLSALPNSSPAPTTPLRPPIPLFHASSPLLPPAHFSSANSPLIPPSSPRLDALPSVSARLDSWHRSGKVAALLHNAQTHTANMPLINDSLAHNAPTLTAAPIYAAVQSTSTEALRTVDEYLRRRHVLHQLEADMLVRGTVYSKTDGALIITLSQIFPQHETSAAATNGPQLSSVSAGDVLDDLDHLDHLSIRGEVHVGELMPNGASTTPTRHDTDTSAMSLLNRYSVGSDVTAVVVSADIHSDKIHLSMNQPKIKDATALLTAAQQTQLKSAETNTSSAVSTTPIMSPLSSSVPTSFIAIPKARTNQPTNYLRWLRRQAIFKNPDGADVFLSAYNINQYGSLMTHQPAPQQEMYKALRHEQNQSWARESVLKGLTLAKKGSHANAIKCYNHALDIEPTFVQALVARGAIHIAQHNFERAVTDLQAAIDIEPNQPTAIRFLAKAKEKMGISSEQTERNQQVESTTE